MNPILAKGRILSNRLILEGGTLYEMNIRVPEIASGATPGQFVQVDCGEGTSLRRPISISNYDSKTLTLCYDVRGKGTLSMAKMRESDAIDLLGPIGHGFELPQTGKVLLVGGGIGIYPLVKPALLAGKRAKALIGFRNASLVNGLDYFTEKGVACAVCTDDGSYGRHSFVTELLEEELKGATEEVSVLICGPMPMMKAAAAVCARYGASAQVSLEERMGCGLGACLACVCKIKLREGEGEKHARVCVDGPVFNARDVIWA